MPNTLLNDLQEDLRDRLLADSYFTDIDVLDESRDLTQEITNSLSALSAKGGKAGTSVIVMQLTASVSMPNVKNPVLDFDIAVRVLEEPIVNRDATNGTLKEALTTARVILRLLHHYIPGGYATCIVADDPAIVPVEDPFASVAYEVRFKCKEADPEPYLKAATPTIGVAGGGPFTITLTQADADSIYYTTDGTFPYSGNDNATLYSTPFNVNAGQLVRAVAFRSGYQASDCAAVRNS